MKCYKKCQWPCLAAHAHKDIKIGKEIGCQIPKTSSNTIILYACPPLSTSLL